MSVRGGPQPIPRPEGTLPGGVAPWAAIAAEARRLTIDDIRVAFAGRAGRPAPNEAGGEGRASAVLAPLYEHDGTVHVILTRRAQHLRAHQGEISFPGGGHEVGETSAAAALREAYEEIGLDPTDVEVVGELDHLTTARGEAYIVPHVGLLAGRPELEPNADEVEMILHVPLDELLLEEVYREERWDLGSHHRSIFFFELVGDTVWGATAAMLRQLLAIATGAPATVDR